MYKLNDKQLEEVLRLPGPIRYEYFIKRIADWGNLYSLQSDAGWALARNKAGSELLPVWPHSKFAELCRSGDWVDCRVVEIPLREWIDRISGILIARSVKVAVFPVPEGQGVIVEPERLLTDLRRETSNFMDDE